MDYQDNNEYHININNKGNFYSLIGELTITFPNYPIMGIMSIFVDGDLINQTDIKVSSIYKYRNLIETFSIEDECIKFWINIEE